MKIDDWFKPLLLVSIIIFLIIFYQYSQNGRYIPKGAATLDSRTGITYWDGVIRK